MRRRGVAAFLAGVLCLVAGCAGTSSSSPPEGRRQNPGQMAAILIVLNRAGRPVAELRDGAAEILAAPRPVFFGTQPSRGSDVFDAPRLMPAMDAILGRDAWLTPKVRDRFVTAARQLAAQDPDPTETTRLAEVGSAMKLLRLLGEPVEVRVRASELRPRCEAGAKESNLTVVSRTLVELGERGCAWSPKVEAVAVATRRSIRDRGEFDLRAAMLLESAANVAEAAGAHPGARAFLDAARTWARAILADRAEARLPDMVDPIIVEILGDVLPPDERLVLSPRIEEHLVRSLEIPVWHFRRTK